MFVTPSATSAASSYDATVARPGPVAGARERWLDRWWPWLAAALLAIHAALAWQSRVPGLTLGNDDAVYVQLARSLRDFSYSDTFYAGAPAHVKYPPGYPAMLAITGALFGEHPDLWLAMGILLSASALALLFDVTRRRWSAGLALLALGTAAVNPTLVRFAGSLMSESTFMFWLALTVWALARERCTRGSMYLAGGAAIMSALTRSAGVTIVAGVLLLWLLERRWKAVAVLASVSAATVGGWLLWTLRAPGGTRGEAYITDTFLYSTDTAAGGAAAAGAAVGGGGSALVRLASRAGHHLLDYLTRLIPVQTPFPTVPGTLVDNLIIVGAIVLLGGVGLWSMWRRWRAVPAVVLPYAALIAVWPWPVSRFLVPMLPIVLIVLFVGAAVVGERVGRWGRSVPIALAAIVLSAALPQAAESASVAARCDRAAPYTSAGCFDESELEFLAATRWVAANTPDSAVFVSAKEGSFGYFTGRRAIPLMRIMRHDSATVLDFAGRSGATFLVLSRVRDSEPLLGSRLLGQCRRLEVVHAVADGAYVFRILPAGETAASDGACAALRRYAEVVRERRASRRRNEVLNRLW